jgi:hypothetical protein
MTLKELKEINIDQDKFWMKFENILQEYHKVKPELFDNKRLLHYLLTVEFEKLCKK